jgi:two-component system sensor histidine kinase ArlS
MTIKSKISLYISILFTFLFGFICVVVYSLFANFRKQEFQQRLEEKAKANIELLQQIDTVDVRILNAIDKNATNELHEDHTLLFNGDLELVYASNAHKSNWPKKDLLEIKRRGSFYRSKENHEIYCKYFRTHDRAYITVISAKDTLGLRKMSFLLQLLIGAYVSFTLSAWIFTFFIVKRQLKSLDDFHSDISRINEQNLNESFVVPIQSKNEIHLLSNEFNHMFQRISIAYQKQKEFTSQASHELRTPLARMSSQLENQLTHVDSEQAFFIKKQLDEVSQLNELISSLLILSKIESSSEYLDEKCRLDEVVYSSIEKVTRLFPNFKVHLEFENSEELEEGLTLRMNAQLLEIVISNLFKNAWIYGDEQSPSVCIGMVSTTCFIRIENKGALLKDTEIEQLYEPFMRGSNAKQKEGLGLGLRIVYRILQIYGYQINYSKYQKLNTFTITF